MTVPKTKTEAIELAHNYAERAADQLPSYDMAYANVCALLANTYATIALSLPETDGSHD